MDERCQLCQGKGETTSLVAYNRMPGGIEPCSRCQKTGIEPHEPLVHAGLVLENRRSGLRWAVYGDFPPAEWGLHRLAPTRNGGSYYFQFLIRPAADLLDARRWRFVGFGDAWNGELMQTPPLP